MSDADHGHIELHLADYRIAEIKNSDRSVHGCVLTTGSSDMPNASARTGKVRSTFRCVMASNVRFWKISDLLAAAAAMRKPIGL